MFLEDVSNDKVYYLAYLDDDDLKCIMDEKLILEDNNLCDALFYLYQNINILQQILNKAFTLLFFSGLGLSEQKQNQFLNSIYENMKNLCLTIFNSDSELK